MGPPHGSTFAAKGPSSFKDVVREKVASQVRQSLDLITPSPYLVKKMEKLQIYQ